MNIETSDPDRIDTLTIFKQSQEQAIDLIILTATKEMMLAKISKDIIDSIMKKLETEKEYLLKVFD